MIIVEVVKAAVENMWEGEQLIILLFEITVIEDVFGATTGNN